MKTDSKNKLFALLGLLIPVCIFFLGYTFNQIDQNKNESRKKENLKIIFNLELQHNYQTLNRSITNANDKDVPIDYYPAMARMLKRLSSDVYSNYLNRIDNLSIEEIEKIYDAYYFINLCKIQTDKVINAFSEINNSNLPPSDAQRTTIISEVMILTGLSETSLEKTSDALMLFPNAENWIREMSFERGADLIKFNELLKEFSNQDIN